MLTLSLGCWDGPDWEEEPEDDDQDGWEDADDCDDDNASVFPGATEWCNGQDDDCDWDVDENAADQERYYLDSDDDGYGAAGEQTYACQQPFGYVTNDDDCDDLRGSSYPGAPEHCDDHDDDCDGRVDEDPTNPPTWYGDEDGDGYGGTASTLEACDEPAGYSSDATDCDDQDAAVHLDALELCRDGVDNDCEPLTPEDCDFVAVDLADADAILLGQGPAEAVGTSLSSAGDVDDDGFGDLIIGGPGSETVADGAYVVGGPVSGTIGLASAWAHLTFDEVEVEAGWSVAGGFDADDDGFDDLLYGGPSLTDGSATPGGAMLMLGPDLVDCSPFCEGALFVGQTDGDRAGSAVSGADLDGDGLDDVVIGASERGAAGAVYVWAAAVSGNVSLADADTQLDGTSDHRQVGAALGHGDLDDDGRKDLVVGDWESTGGRVDVITDALESTADLALAACTVHGRTEAPLTSAAAADVDGDDVADLVVGAALDLGIGGDDAAWVFLGPLTGELTLDDADVRILGEGLYANAGLVVAAGGDIDADGVGDLLLASPVAEVWGGPDQDQVLRTPGTVFVVLGPMTSGDLSLADATWRLHADADRRLDDAVPAFGGDLDRDGFDEIVVGQPSNDQEGHDAGVVYVVGGGALP